MRTSILAIGVIAASACAGTALAQVTIPQHVIAGGGGTSSGGGFTVTGTIGQAVVGQSTNGTTTVQSGFWSTTSIACGLADVASLGGMLGADGQLTVDDIVVYLAAFFAGNLSVADISVLGGNPGIDGQVTVDDLVLFLARFFAGC